MSSDTMHLVSLDSSHPADSDDVFLRQSDPSKGLKIIIIYGKSLFANCHAPVLHSWHFVQAFCQGDFIQRDFVRGQFIRLYNRLTDIISLL